MKRILLACALVAASATAWSHARMDTTHPADGAVTAEVPSHVVLQFATPIRLTLVETTHPDHEPVRVDLGEDPAFAERFELPLADLGKGSYRVEWRGLSADGHIVQGAFAFEVE